MLYTQVLYKQGIVKKRYCINEFCTNEGFYMWTLYKQVVVQTSFCTYEGAPREVVRHTDRTNVIQKRGCGWEFSIEEFCKGRQMWWVGNDFRGEW